MFVRDFADYYSFPVPVDQPDERIVIGDWVPWPKYPHFGGPRSIPPDHCWSESEILPENLVGDNWNNLTESQQSTYRVIRSVSEIECYGFFDSLNAYDNALVSLGPCHWTLGILGTAPPYPVENGELCAFLAYLRHSDTTAFREAMEFFGGTTEKPWNVNGSRLFDSSQRKYTGWLSLQNRDSTYTPIQKESEDEANYFKTWHWFYRFVMAGRTIDGFKRRMWDMARIRLRDIMSTPFRQQAGFPQIVNAQGQGRGVTIGDVYTSERAIALTLRWHIRSPASVASGGLVGNHLENAFGHSQIPAGDPQVWTNNHENMLIEGILKEVKDIGKKELIDNMNYLGNWPDNGIGYFNLDTNLVGNLRDTRGSFHFYDDGLPQRP